MENKMSVESDLHSKKASSEIHNENEPVIKKAKLDEISESLETNKNSSKIGDKIDEDSVKSFENKKKSNANDEIPKPSGSKNINADSDDDIEVIDTDKPERGFDYPIEQDSSDMMDEVELVDGMLPTVTERYLTPYYQIDIQNPGDDICVYVHSNRICMITLAPSHNIFQENKKIVKCDYKVTEKCDRTKNKVSGKGKRGAQPLQSNSNLCRLTCEDGSVYAIKCCMIGKLMEVNTDLIENPELLRKPPHFGGYIAIALPNMNHIDKLTQKTLLNKRKYEIAMRRRRGEVVEDIVDADEPEEERDREADCIHRMPEDMMEDESQEKGEKNNSLKNEVEQLQTTDNLQKNETADNNTEKKVCLDKITKDALEDDNMDTT